MAPRTPKAVEIEDEDPFPRPTRPAGWPEVAMAAWWSLLALIMLGMSATFWATAWPAPTGLAIFKIQLGFAVPFIVAAGGAFIALICGLIGVAKAKLSGPRPTPRRTVRRASATT